MTHAEPFVRRNVFAVWGRYLADGLTVVVQPLTTIREASERRLGYGTVAAVLALLAAIPVLACYALLAFSLGTAAPETPVMRELREFEGATAALASLLGMMTLLLSMVILFAIARLFGGKGDLRRFLSAALVVLAFFTIVQTLSAVLDLAAGEEASHPFWMLPLALGAGLIILSYAVLVARFGALLSFPRAFAAVAVLTAASMLEIYLTAEGLIGGLLNLGLLARGNLP